MIVKKIYLLLILSIYSINIEANNCSKWISIPYISAIHIVVPMCRTANSFGAVGNGITDDTYALVKAFSSGMNLDLEGKRYLIDVSKPGLLLGLKPSNNMIIQGNGAEIILKPNNLEVYSMINLMNVKNVKIYDLKLTGDVKNHQGSTGEWGMGFWMGGSKNCELHRVEANEMWGDGFYVAGYNKEPTEGGGIFNSSARANRRVGITITYGKNFIVKDSTFIDTGTIKYHYPAYGVDFEPNPNSYDSIDNVKLIHITTKNNQGGGVMLVPYYLKFSNNPNVIFNVTIEKFVSKNDGRKGRWLYSGLRFIERSSEGTYTGLVKIKDFNIVNLTTGGVEFRWERSGYSLVEVHATDLKINGVPQNDYHY